MMNEQQQQQQQQQQKFFEKSYQNNGDNPLPLILPKTVPSHHHLPTQQVLQPVVMNSFVTAPVIPKSRREPSIYNQLNMKQTDTKIRQCERKRRSRQRKSKEAPKVATRFLSFQQPPSQHMINQQHRQLVKNSETTQQNEPKVIVSDMLNTTPFFNVKVIDVQASPMKSPVKCSSSSTNELVTTTINLADISPSTMLIPKKSVVENVKKRLPTQSPRSILKNSASKMMLPRGKRQPQLILPHKEIPSDVVLNSPVVVVDKLNANSSRKIKIESQKNDNNSSSSLSSSKDNNKVSNKKLMKVKFNFKSPKKKTDSEDTSTKIIQISSTPSHLVTNQESSYVINKEILQSDSPNVDLEPLSSSNIHTSYSKETTFDVDQQTVLRAHQQENISVDNPSRSPSEDQANNELNAPISKLTTSSQKRIESDATKSAMLKIPHKIETEISDLVVPEPSSISRSDEDKTVEKERPSFKTVETESPSLGTTRHTIENEITDSSVAESLSISTHDQDSTSPKTSHIDFSYSLLHEDTVDVSDRLKDIIKEMKNREKTKTVEHSSLTTSCAEGSSLQSNVNVIPKKSFVPSPLKTKLNLHDIHSSQNTLLEPSLSNTTFLHRTTLEHINRTGQTPEHLASPARSDVGSSVMSSPYAESIDSLDSSPFRGGGGRKRKLSDASDKVN